MILAHAVDSRLTAEARMLLREWHSEEYSRAYVTRALMNDVAEEDYFTW
jgi:hypothetical protein